MKTLMIRMIADLIFKLGRELSDQRVFSFKPKMTVFVVAFRTQLDRIVSLPRNEFFIELKAWCCVIKKMMESINLDHEKFNYHISIFLNNCVKSALKHSKSFKFINSNTKIVKD